jgi:peptide chain release factor 2
VKDLRTGEQSTAPDDVLDGDIDPFIQATLSARIKGGTGAVVEDIE